MSIKTVPSAPTESIRFTAAVAKEEIRRGNARLSRIFNSKAVFLFSLKNDRRKLYPSIIIITSA